MPAWATGRLAGDAVAVDDPEQARRVQARAGCGTPDAGAGAARLVLALPEAAWLAADGRLQVLDGARPLSLADLLAAGPRGGHLAEADYLAYRDLRERGLAARVVAPGRFAVLPRGAAAADPAFTAWACSDGDAIAADLLVEAARAQAVLAVVDADSQLRHYQARLAQPAGEVPEGDLPRARGQVLADRVLVADAAAAEAYHRREALGTPHPGGLLLSFLEAESLRQRGVLAVPAGLAGRTPQAQRALAVHQALRAAGCVPKSGFRFGTALRAYRHAPDDGHAEWLVHCAAPGERIPWDALSRGVRLAHGVRKSFLVAVPGEAGLAFVQLAWFRP